MALLEFVDRGLDALTVLPTAIMGPGDQHFIVGQVIARIVNREFFPLPRGGTNVIDARDAAAAHIAAAERGAPGERYVLGGYNLPHKEMLQAVGEAVGARPRHWQIPHVMLAPVAAGVAALRALHIPCRIDANRVLLAGHTVYYNNSKAVRELGLALRPFRQTVRDTYEWYVAHGLLEPLPVSGQTLSAATD
jgi:dihydroflavonol-4-reductase